jgi:hypothetical protein
VNRVTLKDYLLALAGHWQESRGLSLSRLGDLVANDGSFFARVESGKTFTMVRFEKFIAFFREPANWRDAVVPDHAAALLAELPAHLSTADAGDSIHKSGGDFTRTLPPPLPAAAGGCPSPLEGEGLGEGLGEAA